MKPFTFSSVFATAVLLLAESSSVAAAAEQTYIGCFSSSKPLEDKGSYQYQSNGYCMNLCYSEGKAVFGLHNKDHCLCGDLIPAKSSKESDDSCDTPCAAWPMVKCGGSDAYSIYLTNYKENVAYYSDSSSTSNNNNNNTSSTSDGSSATDTGGSSPTAGDVEMATAAGSSDDDSDKKGGPNTASIAAGVVIGVVGFAALVGAGFFLWRFKNRHPGDQRMREMSNVEQFGKPVSRDSAADSRFDGDFMAQRRQSNGSIDDDRDFSRRILQVTNPDRNY